MTLKRAAHVTIGVAHGSENLMFVGALIGAFFSPAGAALGAVIGKLADRAMPKSITGVIAKGVETVFVDVGRFPAANADPARADAVQRCHTSDIAAGSLTVFVDKWNFSRQDDKTGCGGEIADGCPTVLIGGAPSRTKVDEKASLAARALELVVAGGGLRQGIAKGGWDLFFGATGLGAAALNHDGTSHVNDAASGIEAITSGNRTGLAGSVLGIFERLTK